MNWIKTNHRTFCLALGLIGIGLAGCVSSSPGSTSTAHTVISYASPEQIHEELLRVFRDEHFEVTENAVNRMVFHRPGTERDQVLFGTLSGTKMVMRVEVTTEAYRNDSQLVRADVYVLLDGDVDRKVGRVGSGQYQDLLNRAKASLVTSSR